jgi:site-specific DNA recombinase
MKAALYLRVSTEDQVEKYGLPAQRTELLALAQRRGDTIVEEYSDDGVSGATLERPALARLRDAVRARTVEVVLVHTLDRLSRDLGELLLLLKEWERAGVSLDATDGPLERTPTGRMLVQVKGMVSEYERAMILSRTLRGKRERAKQGRWLGTVPTYGYRATPEGQLVVHDAEAATVRLIFQGLVEEQRGLRQIVRELRALGLATRRGRPWALSTVLGMVRNSVYAGRALYQRDAHTRDPKTGRRRRVRRAATDWITIPVPAIIPPATWEAAQRQLVRNRTGLASGRPGRVYLLKGLCRCVGCGYRLQGLTSHGRRRYYRCHGRDPIHPRRCGAPAWRADDLEGMVWETIVATLRRPGLLAAQIESHRVRLGVRDVEVRSEVAHLRRALTELDRQEGRLLDAYVDETLQVPALRERLAELGRQRAGLGERLAAAEARVADHTADEARRGAIAAFCRQALRGIGALTLEGRQRLLRALVDEIRVGETVEIHGVLPVLTVENCPVTQEQPSSSAPTRYTLLIPAGRRGRP